MYDVDLIVGESGDDEIIVGDSDADVEELPEPPEEVEDFDFLGIVRTLLGIADDSHDKLLKLHIDMTIQAVLNHCNIRELPPELFYSVCNIVVEVWHGQQTLKNAAAGKVIGSISEGGRTVGLKNPADVLGKIKNTIGGMSELNAYREVFRQ
jgi:hypothetical protein